ncbi:hypothetical protein GCM10028801_08410 [Nocardioides maradonensis]
MSGELIEVVDPGLQTTVQAWPGRLGLTAFGYSSAGPMDSVSFRVANTLVGNAPGAPALEVPLIGTTLAFLRDAQVALTGPEDAQAWCNDGRVPLWETLVVKAGDVLRTTSADGPGFRLYLAVAGGIDVPKVYGSAATSLVAGLGGVEGRALVRGDILRARDVAERPLRRMPDALRPRFPTTWEIEVIEGPHARPDYLTEKDWTLLTNETWRVDLNSDRIGTRLHPHRFEWARRDGGPAGGHPSNVLDYAYPRGGVLANGDVLTILGADTNTSGGFAVVATLPECALWKVGQLRPGRDLIRFREVSYAEAQVLNRQLAVTVDPARLVTL